MEFFNGDEGSDSGGALAAIESIISGATTSYAAYLGSQRGQQTTPVLPVRESEVGGFTAGGDGISLMWLLILGLLGFFAFRAIKG